MRVLVACCWNGDWENFVCVYQSSQYLKRQAFDAAVVAVASEKKWKVKIHVSCDYTDVLSEARQLSCSLPVARGQGIACM